MIGFGIGIVVLGVVVAIGAVILTSLGSNSVIANDTVAQGIISNAKDALTNMSSLMGIAGLVVIAAFIIGLVYALWSGRAGQ